LRGEKKKSNSKRTTGKGGRKERGVAALRLRGAGGGPSPQKGRQTLGRHKTPEKKEGSKKDKCLKKRKRESFFSKERAIFKRVLPNRGKTTMVQGKKKE